MTKKHFIALAAGIKALDLTDAQKAAVALMVATVAHADNPRFDVYRFYAAAVEGVAKP